MSASILFVAPSPSEAGLVEAAFGMAGYALVPRETFAAGRRALLDQRHSLAIIDSNLPDGAGVDLLVSTGGTPAVLLCEHREVSERLGILRGGAADCVAKPYDPLHLVARALSVLERRKGRPAILAPGFARRILVVDDSTAYVHALADELHRDGHDVAIARTANDALAYLGTQELDLAVISASLPDMSGLDLCSRMRGAEEHRRTPVILLADRERAVLLGRNLEAGPADRVLRSRDLEAVRMQARRLVASEERVVPPPSRRSVPPARRSVPPPALRDVAPPSQRGVPPSQRTPSSHRSVPPSSHRSVPPSSHRSVPPSQRTPSSHRSVPPPSHRTVPPPSFRDAGPSSQRTPSSHRSVPPPPLRDVAPSSQRTPSSHRSVPPPSFRDAPPSSRRSAPALLDQVAAASGLSRIVGRPAIERACQRAGINPMRLTPPDLERALPEIESALRAFFPPEVVETRMAEITRLARA